MRTIKIFGILNEYVHYYIYIYMHIVSYMYIFETVFGIQCNFSQENSAYSCVLEYIGLRCGELFTMCKCAAISTRSTYSLNILYCDYDSPVRQCVN